MPARRSLWSRALVALLVPGLLLGAVPLPLAAQTAAKPPATRPPVQRGQEYYEQSRFDEAIGLLRDLVDRGALSGEDLIKAREILARSYVKKGYPAQAKEMFKAILKNDPSWRPDPIRVPPDETAVYEQARREFESSQPGAPPSTTPPATSTTPPSTSPPATTTPQTLPPASAVIPPVQEKSGKKGLASQWWVWAGGAALVGGIALAAGGGGGDGGTTRTPLAGPPAPPSP